MMQTLKILMIDSDVDQVYSLREALAVAQIISVEVQEIDDGEEALACLRQEYPYMDVRRPDLIFLGMNLQGMSGPALIDELQKDPQFRGIPIAILTSSTDSDTLRFPRSSPHPPYVFKKPTSCDQWIYVLRCIEDVWLTIRTLPGQRPL